MSKFSQKEHGPRSRRALIVGISGQDGAYLAQYLLTKGYEVFGTSRAGISVNRAGLKYLGIDDRVRIYAATPRDYKSIQEAVRDVQPDEIYNLAGQSSVGLSFDQPVETFESIALGTLNLLECLRFEGRSIRMFNAGSSECFGDAGQAAASESTPLRPTNPYAVAKTSAHDLVVVYRKSYGLSVCTGILFNHESPLRSARFVTQKIIRAAIRISAGGNEKLRLGNLNIYRDWGWAPDFVEAMWLMLQQDAVSDFVIGTGRAVSLEYFVARSFEEFGLDWREYVVVDPTLFRPSDVAYVAAAPGRAQAELGWIARHTVDDVIRIMSRAAVKQHD